MTNQLVLDSHNFISLDQQNWSSSKEFMINAWGELWSANDHMMLVYHKKKIKTIARKDLWNTMKLIRIVDTSTNNNLTNKSSDSFITSLLSVFKRYHGYDEETNQPYYYLPKISWERLDSIIKSSNDFCQYEAITIINQEHWRYQINLKEDISHDLDNVLAQYIALYLIYGKATIRNNILKSYRIQIPYFHYKVIDHIEKIVDKLRTHHFVINSTHNKEHEQFQLDTNDYELLQYVKVLLQDEYKIELHDVLEIKKKITSMYSLPKNIESYTRKLYQVRR